MEQQQKLYSVNEIFYSLQGEGMLTGTPAVFVRFAGCNLKCPFCDTDFRNGQQMTAGEIVARAVAATGGSCCRNVILTGGEPTLQVDGELVGRLHQAFSTISMETNGTRQVPTGIDIVTVSPKNDFVGDYETVKEATEVKVVFDGENNPEKWAERIKAERYYLQPCDTGDSARNRAIIERCVEFIKRNPIWRLSLQTQKILNIR